MSKVDVTKQASRSDNVHFSLKWAKHAGPRSTLAFMNMEYEGNFCPVEQKYWEEKMQNKSAPAL